MDKKDLLLIVNPNASKSKGKEKARSVRDLFLARGRYAAIVYTYGKGHAAALAERGCRYGYKNIIAVGGDGTVNEVLNGILRSGLAGSVKMGIVPVGRGNDFAWFAGIPKDPVKAVDLICRGDDKATDAGFCQGTGCPEGIYFFNGAGFGFEPMVNFRAAEFRHINGMPSYVLAFLQLLINLPVPAKVRLVLDSGTETVETQQVSICNGRRMGSCFIMAPLARFDDGLLDVVYLKVPVKSRLGLLQAVLTFFLKAQPRDKRHFSYRSAEHVTMDMENGSLEAHADGEELTRKGVHFEVSVVPSAIRLLR